MVLPSLFYFTLNKGSGFIPEKGWMYPPKEVVLLAQKLGIKLPNVVLRVVLSTIRGRMYVWDPVNECPSRLQ